MILRSWYVHHTLKRVFKAQNKPFIFLEAGCGNNDYIIPYAKQYKNATFIGVDLLEDSIKMGKFYSKKKGIKNTIYRQCSIEKMPFDALDIIACIGVLQCIKKDQAVLNGFFNKLNKEGVLVLYVPIYEKRFWLSRFLKRTFHESSYDEKYPSQHIYTPETIQKKLELAGFQSISKEFTYGTLGRINYELYQLLITLSSQIPVLFLIFLVPLWGLIYPIMILFAFADFLNHNQTGNGLLIVAKKN